MTKLQIYQVIHILGILFVFTGLGGLLRGGTAEGRKLSVMLHGIGLVVILVAGFGALAQMGMSNPGTWPAWLWIKTVIWLLLGAAPVIIRRAPGLVPLLWVALPVLGAVAAYLAVDNPA
jgi:hypothetical protein